MNKIDWRTNRDRSMFLYIDSARGIVARVKLATAGDCWRLCVFVGWRRVVTDETTTAAAALEIASAALAQLIDAQDRLAAQSILFRLGRAGASKQLWHLQTRGHEFFGADLAKLVGFAIAELTGRRA